MVYIKLLYEFFIIGLFSFGGAYSGIPLTHNVITKYNWCSEDVFANMVAISESTPGSVIVNLATYVGYEVGGLLGGLLATFVAIIPAFVLILIFAVYLKKFTKIPFVQKILDSIKAGVLGVILATGLYMLYTQVFKELIGQNIQNLDILSIRKIVVFAILLLSMIIYRIKKNKINTIAFILFCGIISIAVCVIIK